MQINNSRAGEVLIVAPAGHVDSTNAQSLEKHLLDVLASGARQLVVDFAAVEYVSSAGLRAMLTIVKRVRDGGGGLVLCGMREPVRLVFELAGLLPIFVIEASPDDALSRLETL